MQYNKLVRDYIPEILEAKELQVRVHVAHDAEFDEALWRKLFEEIDEFRQLPSIEEMADILEVFDAIKKRFSAEISEISEIAETNSNAETNAIASFGQLEALLLTLCDVYHLKIEAVLAKQKLKRLEKGGFEHRIILDEVL